MARVKVAVLISGRGSNLQSLIDACADPSFPAEIVHVLSNVAGVLGLERAEQAGIATSVISHRDFPDRAAFDRAVDARLRAVGAELICLAGFMRILTEAFVESWRDRLINIHPSLLPSFKGLHTHERAIAAGVRFAGCTVHFVRPAMDDGPIIVQAAVPILPGDDADGLGRRVLAAEHRCYPLALKLVASGRAVVSGDTVTVRSATSPENATINPAED
ncbi:MAG: phosphoribosylglycinamide formyltransferase [Alphaproteobacteria bacterium]|nr:phosphoribosylglycinamide formyltransferase [Alphaproteobacteria bacterium]MBF0130306.1 phosphoribosylglycinamide formyltransferase [Alphaproteobacteria bacterium]